MLYPRQLFVKLVQTGAGDCLHSGHSGLFQGRDYRAIGRSRRGAQWPIVDKNTLYCM